MNPIKVLILTANPKIPNYESLRLDEEVREIQEALKLSQYRDRFQLEIQLATRPEDLRRALLDHQPQIVHFSGHGSGENGLVLENDAGTMELVSSEALEHLFAASEYSSEYSDSSKYSKVECVLLNACYSEEQAKAIHQIVDCVIGMNKAIGDKAAIQFSIGFYDALGAGRTYEEAYNFGKSAISGKSIPQYEIPVLMYRKRHSVTPLTHPSALQSQADQKSAASAIADPPNRSLQSQSIGNITISGSNNPFNNIQAEGHVTFSQTMSQASGSNTDLQVALEALAKLKQEISATDALSRAKKQQTESNINMIQEELQKPNPEKSFIDETVEALKGGLEGVVALATPVTEVAALIAKAYVGLV